MIVAVDADSPGTVEAEHLLHEVLGPTGPLGGRALSEPVVACTHVVAGGHRSHLAVSITALPAADHPFGPIGEVERVTSWALERGVGVAVSWAGASQPVLAGPSQLVRGAYLSSVECALGTAGRLVRFPGQEAARGIVPVAELRAACGIDRVEPLGEVPVDDNSLVDTLDFIRPIRRNGQVVLLVQPAAGGLLIPFELEHQHNCCADH